MPRPRARFRAWNAEEDGQNVYLPWSFLYYLLSVAPSLDRPDLREWVAVWRLRAWGLPGAGTWATCAVWRDGAWPTLASVAEECARALVMGAGRLRLQAEDGGGAVRYTASWSARRRGQRKGTMGQDLDVGRVDGNTLEKMAGAAMMKGAAELSLANAENIRAFGATVVDIAKQNAEDRRLQNEDIRHYMAQGFENGARAAIAEIWYGAQADQGQPDKMVALAKEVKDGVKDLIDAGFSIGGLLKGDPDKLAAAWRKHDVYAMSVGRLLKRMEPKDWKELGELVGPSTVADLGRGLAGGLGPAKVGALLSAGLTADGLDVSEVWAAVTPQARESLVQAALAALTPAQRQGVRAALDALDG